MLYVVATGRGQATYWLARVVTDQTVSRVEGRPVGDRWVRWLHGAQVARGRAAVQRWGLAAVPLCYLTVGFQTMVLAAAGVLRLSWPAFTVAQVPGALAWALIYTTIGWAAWEVVLAALGGRPLALAAVLAVVVVVVATRLTRPRRPAVRPPDEPAGR